MKPKAAICGTRAILVFLAPGALVPTAAAGTQDDKAVLADLSRALAAFVETLGSPSTPFDRFREALARGAGPR